MKINEHGQEILSQKPIAAPVRVGPSPNTLQALAAQYRAAYELARLQGGNPESPEEAEDFNIGDYDDAIPFENLADRYDEDLFQQMLALHKEQVSRETDLQQSSVETGETLSSSGNPNGDQADK